MVSRFPAFAGEYTGPFTPDPEEIAEFLYLPLDELKQDMIVCPN